MFTKILTIHRNGHNKLVETVRFTCDNSHIDIILISRDVSDQEGAVFMFCIPDKLCSSFVPLQQTFVFRVKNILVLVTLVNGISWTFPSILFFPVNLNVVCV